MTIGQLLLALLATFAAAKVFGELAERIGQPAVLGEMFGGIVIGVSGLHLLDPHQPVVHLFAELGVILLLFLIGLETDLSRLLAVGGTATAVAVVGVVVPFACGFATGRLFGYPTTVSVFLGAALTATSVGITARVLSDLGQLESRESQVILGAAVIDDILGLVLLTVVASFAAGREVTMWGVGRTLGTAVAFVVIAIVIGSVMAPRLIAIVARVRVAKALFFASLMFAFGLAWIADAVGSALIIGAFTAGLVLARTGRGVDIAREVHDAAQFFIPIFFVAVGAAVDIRTLNPFHSESRPFFIVGLVLTAVAVIGKFLAGYAAFRGQMRRNVIGVGMIPRGEVGLIFAQLGLSTGLLTAGLYSSVAMMVMITTFIAPPILRSLFNRGPKEEAGIVSEIVTEAMSDKDPL